jgi:hypothetical protein
MKKVQEQFGHNPEIKMTSTRDPEGSTKSKSVNVNKQMSIGKQKNKLSKRDSVFFKPTEKDNKKLGELLIKVESTNTESSRAAAIHDKRDTLQYWRCF